MVWRSTDIRFVCVAYSKLPVKKCMCVNVCVCGTRNAFEKRTPEMHSNSSTPFERTKIPILRKVTLRDWFGAPCFSDVLISQWGLVVKLYFYLNIVKCIEWKNQEGRSIDCLGFCFNITWVEFSSSLCKWSYYYFLHHDERRNALYDIIQYMMVGLVDGINPKSKRELMNNLANLTKIRVGAWYYINFLWIIRKHCVWCSEVVITLDFESSIRGSNPRTRKIHFV